jgi:ABC-type sugar transport system ATPase subunit
MAQKQMVEIAKALTFDANIIIFDEPTASLTHREVDALFKIINTLRAEGRGIVYISHRIEEIFQICNRVTIVRDGQYIDTKEVSETNKDEIVRLMVGREMTNYYPKTETVLGKEIFKVEHYYDEGFLEDVNFYAREGEILGFAGLAGAGRTELMQSICGFTGKAAGRVIMDGKDIDIKNYNDAKSSGIVYVSEDRGKYGLIVDMSIEQNITLPQLKEFANKLSLIDVDKESKVADQYIKDIGIKAPDSKFLVTNLSGGNQQKVAVSKALALKPRLLILDEPTRGVDVNAKAEIHKIISELTKKKLMIIMISSELPELLGMCDRIYVMNNGRIKGSFERKDFSQESILSVALGI